ncbi:MAG: dihydroorotase [Deltaproteobacteria bacterium]|nr:dihydroorotase [Deltaproteobacteria bacterium]
MSRILIRNGRLLDPVSRADQVGDVLVEEGRIARLGSSLEAAGAEVIEAEGCWVAPGLVDMHVHLREPGYEYKEDIASGGRAAVAGGFSAVACMANTRPANDDPSVTKFIIDQARQNSPARIYPIAAATVGLGGEVMTEMAALYEAGAVAFSDDGATVENAGLMRRVLEYSKMVNAPVVVHAEDAGLRGGGVVNEGAVSTRLGLPGNPCAAEEVRVARDLSLARLTGARLHVAHVSTAAAVELIGRARDEGVQVTAEVTPHHLTLDDSATQGYDTNTKVSPPLRSKADIEACRRGLASGVIDVIATDHAPHASYEKDTEFVSAPPGLIGLETAFPVVMDLVRSGELEPLDLLRCLSTNAARILGRRGGQLGEGLPADLVVLDPEHIWKYVPAEGYSKSRNSPWAGKELVGRAVATLVAGEVVYRLDRGVID